MICTTTRENLSSWGGGGGGGGGSSNNTGADQPVHRRSLTSVFVIHLLGSIISRFDTSEISIF